MPYMLKPRTFCIPHLSWAIGCTWRGWPLAFFWKAFFLSSFVGRHPPIFLSEPCAGSPSPAQSLNVDILQSSVLGLLVFSYKTFRSRGESYSHYNFLNHLYTNNFLVFPSPVHISLLSSRPRISTWIAQSTLNISSKPNLCDTKQVVSLVSTLLPKPPNAFPARTFCQ